MYYILQMAMYQQHNPLHFYVYVKYVLHKSDLSQ